MEQMSTNQLHVGRDRPKKASFIKVRFLIAVLATLCPVVCYIGRQNLPLAVVSMIEDTHIGHDAQSPHRPSDSNGDVLPRPSVPDHVLGQDLGLLDGETNSTHDAVSTISVKRVGRSNSTQQSSPKAAAITDVYSDTCPAPEAQNDADKTTSKGYGPKYLWTQDNKGHLLGAFFWTYVVCQIPGARLAESIGPKWILATASAGTAVFSLASPWAASVDVYLFSLVRLLMGACQAALYPTCFVLYTKWLPPIERSQALPILCVGAYVGSIVASSLTGYFSEMPSFGWEYSFYVPGVMCAIWTILWCMYASDEPRDHHSISIEELVYIESKLERSASGQASPRPEISWRKLFKSQSIWAMMAGFFASNWSFTIVLLLIPTYLNKILHVSPMRNGVINSIIYILYCIASPLVGSGSTMMVETRACGLSRLNIRKLFQGTALFGQALCFIALPLVGCNECYVFTVLYIQIILFSFVNGGEVQLPTELSVDFAGSIYAIGNCVGSSTGFIVPIVFSWIVCDESSRSEWKLYFYLAALITAIGGLMFVLFALNSPQDFSVSKEHLSESGVNICKIKGSKGSLSINLEDSSGYYRQTDVDKVMGSRAETALSQ